MQPQDTGSTFDFAHAISAFSGAIIGAVATMISWIYAAGGREPKLNLEFQQDIKDSERELQKNISAAEQRVEAKVEDTERRAEEKLEELIKHFADTFAALREQMNLNMREVDRDFLRKDEFKEFRKEWREDKGRLFEKLDDLLRRP